MPFGIVGDAFSNFDQATKKAYGALDKSLGGILPGGAERTDTVKKYMAAPEAVMISASEALPAITMGMGGVSRTDTSIDPRMVTAIKDAQKKAESEGVNVDYKHYDSTTPGGLAARLTMGRIGQDEFTRNDAGEVTGFSQVYDTDKTVEEALSEFNPLNLKTYYKPVEASLAQSQKSGVTTHDIDFDSNNNVGPLAMRIGLTEMPGNISSMDDVFETLDSSTPASSGSYTVNAGDTLSSIASAYNTTVEELARKNNINDINMINAGSILDL